MGAPLNARAAATWTGFSAILMWALLALMTDATAGIPPFQTSAISFAIGTLVGLVWLVASGNRSPVLPRPGQRTAWLVGVAGLFGYHALYFAALKNAPAVEASLIAYLWPLLIVAGSALLPGERLRWFHGAGALLGFAGTALIVTGGKGLSLSGEHGLGYMLALAAAFTWMAYSLASRRFASVPTSAVIGYCAATALLSALCSAVFETVVWPIPATAWLALIGLGLLPVGAAFYAWDHGVKRGNIQLLGVASYASPLVSTVVLIGAGRAEATTSVIAACVLITAGALLASLDTLARRRTAEIATDV